MIHPDDQTLFDESAAVLDADLRARLRTPAHGGATRQESVRHGLELLDRGGAEKPETVLIHDGARPFSTAALIASSV